MTTFVVLLGSLFVATWEDFNEFCEKNELGNHEQFQEIFEGLESGESLLVQNWKTEDFIIAYARWLQHNQVVSLVVHENTSDPSLRGYNPDVLFIFTKYRFNRSLNVSTAVANLYLHEKPSRIVFINCREYPSRLYIFLNNGQVPITIQKLPNMIEELLHVPLVEFSQ